MAALKAGRYELQDELGRGAMGVVYRAFDPMIGRTVAVKTMKFSEEGSGLARPELLARFQTEARAAGQLVHPNIVIIYDAGENEGLYYITMEFVEGRSLQSLIDQKQPFPLARVMRIMGQVCSALEFAHQRNVVHRDVKPANIVLAADDTVKVTDFGTAKILQLGTTQSGTIVGTPSYMSPEQIKGKPVDGRADVFSLGVILYELITGEKPFPGESITTVIYKIVNEQPISPRELDSSVHPGLNAVITKALAKEPEERYQSCKELMQDLLNYRAFGATAGTPAEYGATVVVVGRPGPPAVPPPPPPPEPAPSKTGTLSGMPSLSAPPPAPKAPLPAPPAPVEETPTTIATPRFSPGASSLPSLTSTSIGLEDAAEQHKAKSRPALVALLLVLLAIGSYLIWPTLNEVIFRKPDASQVEFIHVKPEQPTKKTTEAPPAKSSEVVKSADAPAVESTAAPIADAKSSAPPPKKETVAEPRIAPADLALRIERMLVRNGLAANVKVDVRDNVVRFTGTPNPRQRRRMQQMAGQLAIPAGYSVEYAFGAQDESAADEQPRTAPAPGMGEIEVITDINGAAALLTGPGGKSDQCRTPCRFEDLVPGRYALEVSKDGYRTEKRIMQLARGAIKPVTISLQAGAARLEIISKPSGADILINGQRQGRQTPATVPVAPGRYRIGVQKPGFAPYEESMAIAADELKKVNVTLGEQRKGNGWVDIRSVPPGADILIDGTNTGQKTPAKLELPSGQYMLMLYLSAHPAVRETITILPGQTVQVYKSLAP